MKKNIAVLPGDGVGPEVVAEAIKVLKKIESKYKHEFTFTEALIGAVAIDKTGNPFPKETEELCKTSDAILFGAIGDPRFDNNPSAKVRPEQGLLAMRKALGLYANVRPIFTFKNLSFKSPLKEEIIKNVDFIVIRELTGGIYFGEPRGRSDGGTRAFDTSVYTKEEVLRVSTFAFELAMKRRKHVTMVDKANVLETSRLWRETVQEFAKSHPEVTVEYMFVDNASMQIVKRPSAFDVVLTENMFGDILTDEASVITGSLGMLPSASMGSKVGLYEPVHGSYPKAAGLNIANPVGTILSAAIMLDYSFGCKKEADNIRNAVSSVLETGKGTKDVVEKSPMSTSAFGDEVVKALM